ncbi:hypothetical protein ACUXST_002246 [Sphingomonas sp. F9_3S_D5_B_2]
MRTQRPKIGIHGIVDGNIGARFVKGIPALNAALQNGAVQVRPLGFDHNDAVFTVLVFNAGSDPANISLEDMHAAVSGAPVRIGTGQDLARQAKNRVTWAQIGIAFSRGSNRPFILCGRPDAQIDRTRPELNLRHAPARSHCKERVHRQTIVSFGPKADVTRMSAMGGELTFVFRGRLSAVSARAVRPVGACRRPSDRRR